MAVNARTESVARELGFADTDGFVDGTREEAGAVGYVWRDLADKGQVDAAYFRGAVPLVAFADAESPAKLQETHRRLWNLGRVPILIATTPEQTLVVDCAALPVRGETPILAAAPTSDLGRVREDFTRYAVERGRAQQTRPGQRSDRVDRHLLSNLRQLRASMMTVGARPEDIEPLLGRSILVRYLEDRGILTTAHLAELGASGSFVDTLAAGAGPTRELFDALAEHFNGDVFRRDSAPELNDAAAHLLGQFFEGTDLTSGQGALWAYDFGIIPPQLVSAIYEQLLEDTQDEDAAYYTPRHIVELILDEVIPWGSSSFTGRILDPSCGSGIFLAEAFRRLAYSRTTSTSARATYAELRDLLTSTVFGIDVNPAAVGVSAFSLYLALLEHVDSPTVWRSARLPDLVGTNLVVADFFEHHALVGTKFDTVLGNPPWKSKLPASARRYLLDRDRRVADQQLANAFVWRALDFMTDDATLAMVLPAKWLLHNRSAPAIQVRRDLVKHLDVQTIVDLSPLRHQTFQSATNPAAVAVAQRRGHHEEFDFIVHVSPRSTPLTTTFDGLVIDQQNINHVPKSVALDPSTWKTLLWGTPADLTLVSDLRRRFAPLRDLIATRGWVSGTGYQVGGGNRLDSTHMVDMPIIEARDVAGPYARTSGRSVFTRETLHYPRDRRIYRAPHILLRKGLGSASGWEVPYVSFHGEDAVFTDSLYAVAGRDEDADELKAVAALMNSSIVRYWLFMTSSSWGVERPQIFAAEFKNTPIPALAPKARTLLAEVVDRMATKPIAESDWLAAVDDIAFDLYELRDDERRLVTDTTTARQSEYQAGAHSSAFNVTTNEALMEYTASLQAQLDGFGQTQWTAQVHERNLGYVVVVCTGSTISQELRTQGWRPGDRPFTVETFLNGDAPFDTDPPYSAVIVQPSAVWVDNRDVYIAKADELRCWLPSTGTADAALVLEAVISTPARDPRA